MFTDFFYLLRKNKMPVSLQEWMVLLKALKLGLIDSDLNRFYTVSRAILVKDEAYYDLYDQCFAHFFKDAVAPTPLDQNILEWLDRTPLERFFSPEELEQIKKLSLEELQELFEQRQREQKEAHNGGNRWIGTGGTSPFGHGGYNPAGIRVGGAAGGRSAVKVASERKFRNYRNDLTLDLRQIQLAMKKLRILRRFGNPEELDMDGTIDRTCRNGGDIDLVFHASRKNQTRVLLLMDAGGTMDPYADLVSLLFSAAHSSTHFKDFKYFYFHNCVYSKLYTDMERREGIPTAEIMRKYGSHYKLIFVGDAWMSPYELYYDYGAIDYHARERQSGLSWLMRLRRHFTHAIWLNPERRDYWNAETITAIRQVFPMFSLTLQGLDEGIQELVKTNPTYLMDRFGNV